MSSHQTSNRNHRPAAIPWLSYRFTAMDAVAAGFYLAFVLVFAFVPGIGAAWLLGLIPDPVLASYSLNLAFYGCAGLLALVAARAYIAREARILATRPLLTLALVPAGVLAMMLLTVVAVLGAGPSAPAVNQEAVQGLVVSLPPLLIVPLTVVIAPFVEEYIFRHLLIGKLSQYVNLWICCAASVVLFAAIHVVGKEALALPVLLPYLVAGVVLVGFYVWAGKNFMLSYAIHAAKNLLAVVVTYAVPAELLAA